MGDKKKKISCAYWLYIAEALGQAHLLLLPKKEEEKLMCAMFKLQKLGTNRVKEKLRVCILSGSLGCIYKYKTYFLI